MSEVDPIELFGAWYRDAERSGIELPEAMALATVRADGQPTSRMLLLKSFDEGGFVFYTNYGSAKAHDLEHEPRASMLFHWTTLQRQVRIQGETVRVSAEESAEYFQTRPRGSRIGAWASRQSEALSGRPELEARFREMEARFGDGDVPLPPFWGGYRLVPSSLEFWQGRPDRLHDRSLFTREGDAWAVRWLYP